MSRSSVFLALLFLAAAPIAVAAKTPGHRGHNLPKSRFHAHFAVALWPHHGLRTPLSLAGMSDPGAILDRRDSEIAVVAPPGRSTAPTQVSYSLANSGVIGNAGYLQVDDDQSVASPQASLARSEGLDRPLSFVGAGVRYRFK